MSETEQKEIETVTGTIKGVIVKGTDKWQVEVQPEGSQYTKKLWTKDAELIETIPAKIGQHGAFVCGISEWTNNDNKQVRSLWINQEADGSEPAQSVATPAASSADAARKAQTLAAGAPKSESLSKDEWARKDSAADKRACIAIAVSALTHTMPSDPTTEDLGKFIGRVKYLSREWHVQVEAVRSGDDSDVPFSPELSEHDQAIPF